MKILDIEGMQILDSRGNPTLQVEVLLEDGSKGVFKVPSGASTGVHEALELRDLNKNVYNGKGVEKCIEHIEEIKDDLLDINFSQKDLDNTLISLDGTENKSLLGANTILGISAAFAKAKAQSKSQPLHKYLGNLATSSKTKKRQPTLFSNIINGGLHSGNGLNIQEFMIIPLFDNISQNIRAVSEVYQKLKDLIEKEYGKSETGVGDEGGFAPNLSKTEEALDLLVKAIEECNYSENIKIALDCAASDFYNIKTKTYEVEKDVHLDFKKLTVFYKDLIQNYPIISIEDPMAEDDFEGFQYFMKHAAKVKEVNPISGKKEILVVGDDLTVTNPLRVKEVSKKKLCNTLLLKINQIGSITESIEAYNLAISSKWEVIVSHRSGETTDSFISDLAVGLNSSIKLGAPARGERVAKYNRLLEIYRYD